MLENDSHKITNENYGGESELDNDGKEFSSHKLKTEEPIQAVETQKIDENKDQASATEPTSSRDKPSSRKRGTELHENGNVSSHTDSVSDAPYPDSKWSNGIAYNASEPNQAETGHGIFQSAVELPDTSTEKNTSNLYSEGEHPSGVTPPNNNRLQSESEEFEHIVDVMDEHDTIHDDEQQHFVSLLGVTPSGSNNNAESATTANTGYVGGDETNKQSPKFEEHTDQQAKQESNQNTETSQSKSSDLATKGNCIY